MRRVGVTTQVSCLSATCEEHACLLSVFKEKNQNKTRRATKLERNMDFYWRESHVGNSSTRASNWTGVTFAEQGVAALMSELKRISWRRTCITEPGGGQSHTRTHAHPHFPSPNPNYCCFYSSDTKKIKQNLTVTLDRVFSHFAANGQLVEALRGELEEGEKKNQYL